MLSNTDSTITKERAAIAAWITDKVAELPNLTADERSKVREIATSHAYNHGMLLQTKEEDGRQVVVAVGEPNYAGLANLVRTNPEVVKLHDSTKK